LPEAYLHGFLDMLRSGEHHRAFLMGEIRAGGWWSFFPITFALKTPIPMLLFVAAALLLSLGPAGWRRVDAYLLFPVVIYAGMAAAHGLSIGHRHLLPIDPFLFVAAGRLAAWPLARPAPRLVAAVAAAAAGLVALGTIRNHPDHLAYFNRFAGGPEGGYRYLVDSNLDWGQDLKGLAAWLAAHPGPRPKISYFGAADPAYYGIDADFLPSEMRPMPERVVGTVRRGDRLAISVTNLQALYLPDDARPLMTILRTRRPVAAIGHSIFVYDADFDWPPPPGSATPR
ncbi:MAG TPA: hypothetical protein VMQ62_04845, partial [Dongiaceae bacterium]|nr:hypothetical protein [Dongiaceae bacterium]